MFVLLGSPGRGFVEEIEVGGIGWHGGSRRAMVGIVVVARVVLIWPRGETQGRMNGRCCWEN